MNRVRIATVLAAALALSACSNSPAAPTTDQPTPAPVTDTFSGTLNRNGASSFAFSVSAGGAVYATLTSVADSTTVGLSLGTWSGTSCTIVLSNDQAVQGTTVVGAASGVGTLCARVYDVGKVVSPVDYQITVVHP